MLKKQNLVLIKNVTHLRETLTELPIRLPLTGRSVWRHTWVPTWVLIRWDQAQIKCSSQAKMPISMLANWY